MDVFCPFGVYAFVFNNGGVKNSRVVGLKKRGDSSAIACIHIGIQNQRWVGADSCCKLDAVEIFLRQGQVLGSYKICNTEIFLNASVSSQEISAHAIKAVSVVFGSDVSFVRHEVVVKNVR